MHLQLVLDERKVLACDEMPYAIAHLTIQQNTSRPVSIRTYLTISNSHDHTTTSHHYTPGFSKPGLRRMPSQSKGNNYC